MKMTFKPVSALCALVAFVGACATTPKTTAAVRKSDFQIRFEDLVHESQLSKSSCDLFLSQIKFIQSQPLNREDGVRLLEKLEANPGTPFAAREANRLLLNQNVEDFKGQWFLDAMPVLYSFCGTLEFPEAYAFLVENRKRLKFTKNEIERLTKVGIVSIEKECEYPSRFDVALTELSVLKTLDQSGLIRFQVPQKKVLRKLEADSKRLQGVVSELEKQANSSTYAAVVWKEMTVSAAFKLQLLRLMQSIINPD